MLDLGNLSGNFGIDGLSLRQVNVDVVVDVDAKIRNEDVAWLPSNNCLNNLRSVRTWLFLLWWVCRNTL